MKTKRKKRRNKKLLTDYQIDLEMQRLMMMDPDEVIIPHNRL
jgi:hypothetical protein